MNEELEFDDLTLGATSSVDEIVDDTTKDPVSTDPKDVQKDPEPTDDKPKRGRPKKSEPDTGTKDEPASTDEPDGNDNPDGDSKDPDEPTDEPTGEFVKSLAERFGLEIPEDMEFEDTEEGLEEFVQYASDEMADAKLNNWLGKLHPVAQEFFDYMTMLGEEATEEKVQAFFGAVKPEIDYKSINLEDTEVQKSVMKTFFKKMDYSDEEIKDTIDEMEISGTLKKQASIASKKLEASQEKERTKLLEQEREANKVKQQKINQFWGEVKTTVETGKVGNFNIPINERKALLDYDTTGEFSKELNEILRDPKRRVELAIAVKNKFNLSKYIATAAATSKAASLKDKLKSSNGKLKGGNQVGSVVNSDIDWEY
jgi:hypothetical protein